MGQYYFTVASLPDLDFETVPSMGLHDFLTLCRGTVNEHDYEILESARFDGFLSEHITYPLLVQWSIFEQSLRNELVKIRAPRLGIDGEKYVKQFMYTTAAAPIARNSVKQDDPERAEAYLDKERWIFLDDLEVGHYFDIGKLIVYSLRLQLLERRKLFTAEKGKEHFQKLYEQIKTAIKNA